MKPITKDNWSKLSQRDKAEIICEAMNENKDCRVVKYGRHYIVAQVKLDQTIWDEWGLVHLFEKLVTFAE